MAGRKLGTIACVLLSPWPLEHVRRQHPGVPAAVLSEARRVVQACSLAQQVGVQPGLREVAALSRCPDLHAEVVPAPESQAVWSELHDAGVLCNSLQADHCIADVLQPHHHRPAACLCATPRNVYGDTQTNI